MREIVLANGEVGQGVEEISKWVDDSVARKDDNWFRFFPCSIRCSDAHDIDWTMDFAKKCLVPSLPEGWEVSVEGPMDTAGDSRGDTVLYIKTKRIEMRQVTLFGKVENHECHVNIELHLRLKPDMELAICGIKLMPKLVVELD